jgi:transcription initiation factor TFIID TATA-box-binding protein
MTELQVKHHSAKYRIENIVISVVLKRDIDLHLIADAYNDVEFNMNKFPGVCIRILHPKCTILLFKNGKMILTGLKNSKDGDVIVKKVIERFNHVGIELMEPPELKIVNIVVSLNLQHHINLDKATLILLHSIYEPEVFPGLIYRAVEPNPCAFLIFSSGKVILAGLKEEQKIIPAIKHLGKQLRVNGLLDDQR